MIRSLQQKVVAMQQADAVEFGDPEAMIKVFAETTITDLMVEGGRIAGAFGYFRDTGRFVLFEAPAVVLATGGIGKTYKVTSNSWEYTGDGHALALRAGAKLLNMEFVQLHPTGMVWPPSVRGLLVTESVRGDGGVLRNSEGKRFMFDYVPDVFRAQYAETEEEADRWYDDPDHNRRPPELLPRDEVARSINSEVKAGRGSPHGGVFLDIASRRPAEYILQRLPSMYHQFKELADVDITKEPMEIGPTCHYVMGGVEVDPDTGAASVPGLFAVGEVSGGMHGSNRLGGNSLSDLLVFGRRSGLGAAEYVSALPESDRPSVSEAALDAAAAVAVAPLERAEGENPYAIHGELQVIMNDLVGLIRRESEMKTALVELDKLRAREAQVSAAGGRAYNPGWHLALDLRNMLVVAECVAQAALERQESRGGHTRDDYPGMSPEWRKINLICSATAQGTVSLTRQPNPPMRTDLLELFDVSELKKYMTEEELAGLSGGPTRLRRSTDGVQGCAAGLARGRGRRRTRRLPGRGQRGRGRPRRAAPAAGDPGQRPGHPVELQGGQVRVVLDGDQRAAPAGLHDPDVDLHAGRDADDHADAHLPGDQGPGDRRLVQLRQGAGDPVVHPGPVGQAGRVPDAAGRREPVTGVPQVH